MGWAITVGEPFDEVLTPPLPTGQGFGRLTEIDLAAALKEKNGPTFHPGHPRAVPPVARARCRTTATVKAVELIIIVTGTGSDHLIVVAGEVTCRLSAGGEPPDTRTRVSGCLQAEP